MNVIPLEEQNARLYLSRQIHLQTLNHRWQENKTLNRVASFGRLTLDVNDEYLRDQIRDEVHRSGSKIRIKDQEEGSGVRFKDQDPWHLAALAITVYWALIWYLIGCLDSFGGYVLKGLLQRFDSGIKKLNNTFTHVEIMQVLLILLCKMLICWCWNNGYDIEYEGRAYPLARDKLFMC